jgi:hypothetical protein
MKHRGNPGLWTLSPHVADRDGGQGGIRTRDRVAPIHTFQACAFNHSATCPQRTPVKAHAKLTLRTRQRRLALCAFNHSATCPQRTPVGCARGTASWLVRRGIAS